MEKSRLEEQVNDIIHCFICYGKVYKPYMCQICHKLYCQDCLKLWFKNGGKNCAMCKTNFKISDFIEIPWMDDLSTYMIEEQSKSKNTENKKNNNVNNNYEINENDNLNNELLDNDKKFCSFHIIVVNVLFFGIKKKIIIYHIKLLHYLILINSIYKNV